MILIVILIDILIKENTSLENTVTRLTEEKEILLRTHVMYEHDKRELEQELTAKQKEIEKEAAEKLLLMKEVKGYVSQDCLINCQSRRNEMREILEPMVRYCVRWRSSLRSHLSHQQHPVVVMYALH